MNWSLEPILARIDHRLGWASPFSDLPICAEVGTVNQGLAVLVGWLELLALLGVLAFFVLRRR